MANARSASAALVSLVIFGSCLAIGCADATPEPGARGTTGVAAPIALHTTGGSVAVENLSGGPLKDIAITVTPVGNAGAFTTILPALGTGERREVPLGRFKNANGAEFNTMFVRPKAVSVSAMDSGGGKQEASARWSD